MSKELRGGINMSKKALAACLVAFAVVFTGGIVTFNRTIQIKGGTAQFEDEEDDLFKLKSNVKVYNDIEKIEDVLNFQVKFPNVSSEDSSIDSLKIRTILQKNVLEMYLKNNDIVSNENFCFYEFKGEAIDIITELERPNAPYNHTIEASAEEKAMGNISGQDITISIDKVQEETDEENADLNYQISKYFTYQENDITYAIKYNTVTYGFTSFNIEESKVSEILSSLVDSNNESIKNMISKVSKTGIYDESDIEKAENIVGFTPKIPLKINAAVTMNECILSEIKDENIENSEINYKIESCYNGNDETVQITQSKVDEDNFYNELKINGYFEKANRNIYTQNINVCDTEVIKYVDKTASENEIGFLWTEGGIYYKVICKTTKNTQSYEYIVKSILNCEENN